MATRLHVNMPTIDTSKTDDIDYNQVRIWSELSLRARLTLPDTARIFRGQTAEDERPNKDLYELKSSQHPDMKDTIDIWNDIVNHGVVPRWLPTKP